MGSRWNGVHILLIALVLLKLWTEVALLALVGQGVLALLIGRQREHNLIYNLLRAVSRPAVWLVAWLAPRGLQSRHHTLLAGLVLALLWLAVTAGKLWLCLGPGGPQCL